MGSWFDNPSKKFRETCSAVDRDHVKPVQKVVKEATRSLEDNVVRPVTKELRSATKSISNATRPLSDPITKLSKPLQAADYAINSTVEVVAEGVAAAAGASSGAAASVGIAAGIAVSTGSIGLDEHEREGVRLCP